MTDRARDNSSQHTATGVVIVRNIRVATAATRAPADRGTRSKGSTLGRWARTLPIIALVPLLLLPMTEIVASTSDVRLATVSTMTARKAAPAATTARQRALTAALIKLATYRIVLSGKVADGTATGSEKKRLTVYVSRAKAYRTELNGSARVAASTEAQAIRIPRRPSPSPTATPSASPSPTPSPTPTPSATPSPTPTPASSFLLG